MIVRFHFVWISSENIEMKTETENKEHRCRLLPSTSPPTTICIILRYHQLLYQNETNTLKKKHHKIYECCQNIKIVHNSNFKKFQNWQQIILFFFKLSKLSKKIFKTIKWSRSIKIFKNCHYFSPKMSKNCIKLSKLSNIAIVVKIFKIQKRCKIVPKKFQTSSKNFHKKIPKIVPKKSYKSS